MLKKFKNALLIAGGLTIMLVPAIATVGVASAQDQTLADCTSQGADLNLAGNSGTSGCTESGNDQTAATDLSNLAKVVVNVFSIVVGIMSVIMIIVGGMKYVASGGESSAVSGAKNTILFALIGLVIVALAQIVVHFVLAKLTTGTSIT